MPYYLALGAGILFGVAGQIALKSGAEASATTLQQLLNPLTVLGFAIYGVAGLLYTIAIKGIPVSIAFPSVAASYILVAILAHMIWREPLGFQQVGGILLIGCGLVMIHLR